MSISRRGFIVAMPLAVAGCVTHQPPPATISEPAIGPSYLSMYAAIDTEPFPVPAVDLKRVKPRFLRLAAHFNVRGGIHTTVVAEHRQSGWTAPPQVNLP